MTTSSPNFDGNIVVFAVDYNPCHVHRGGSLRVSLLTAIGGRADEVLCGVADFFGRGLGVKRGEHISIKVITKRFLRDLQMSLALFEYSMIGLFSAIMLW